MHNPKPVQISGGTDARSKILRGAQILAKAVAVTYGPYGRTTLLNRAAGLLSTKDGVTVAREIDLSDPVERIGAQILKDACLTVNNDSGDGTTTTAIITAAILEEGHRLVTAGIDPLPLSKGIEAAAIWATELLSEVAIPVTTQNLLERVAMIASNGDKEVSSKMAEAVMAVGKDGTLAIENGNSVGITLNYKEGMEIDRGPASSSFLGGERERIIEGPLVAVIGATLRTAKDVTSMMEVASQWPDHHLIVIAEGIEGEALKTMVLNDHKGVMKCVAIPAPGFHTYKKEYLKDIAALAGTDCINPELGYDLQDWDSTWFGTFRKATLKSGSSLFITYDEASSIIQKRIQEIRGDMRKITSDYELDRGNERIAKLSGGLCIMEVGGFSEAEMKERRARIEDALGSVRGALESGVLPGGGISYLYASQSLMEAIPEGGHEWQQGWMIFARALEKPLYTLARNTGFKAETFVEKGRDLLLREGSTYGIDLLTGAPRDLLESPEIIDPLAVALAVIKASASAAKTMLMVEAAVTVKS